MSFLKFIISTKKNKMNLKTDVIIIGGGVIGLSIGYFLSKNKINTIILEKNKNFGEINSSRNTEVIHAGIYYKKKTLKSQLCIKGKNYLYEFCKKYNVKYKKIGKIFLANSNEDIKELEKIINLAKLNGITDLQEIDSKKLKIIEPNINGKSGILSPSSGIFDSYDFMQKLLNLFLENDGIFAKLTPFLDAEYSDKDFIWKIKIGGKEPATVDAKLIINSAGLDSINLSKKIFPKSTFPISNPVKGGYLKYSGTPMINHIIYPTFTPGIIKERVDATPNINGELRFGPSVEKTKSIDDFSVPSNLLDRFIPIIKKFIPNIDVSKIHIDQAGIRPKVIYNQNTNPDFLIKWKNGTPWLDLFGIESPGLTASLSIGEYVLKQVLEKKIF